MSSRKERLLLLSDPGPFASTCVVPEAMELPPAELMLCLDLSAEAELLLPTPEAARRALGGCNELTASWGSAMDVGCSCDQGSKGRRWCAGVGVVSIGR